MKKLLSISICFVLLCTYKIYALDINEITFNGEEMTVSVNPIIENQTILVPIKDICETLGATVTWNGEDQSVFVVKNDTSVWLQQGNILAVINNKQVTLPVVPRNSNGVMLVPIKFIAEIFGGKVDWDDTNKKISITTLKMIWPIPRCTKVSRNFGFYFHPILKKKKLYTGIFIPAPQGMPIVSVADGQIIYSARLGTYGKTIIIDHGNGICTLYAHCSELLVNEDSQVKAGDEIAKSGNTGYTTGPCLHFEVREYGIPVDPNKYLRQ
ncbi:peptidoglycan DD-metalloendopeptidase family protein [Inediibacterium massiliense]|uniref:peptidoglycan DD-metalloendopeptidase family protein n=1 Tax=Inediibacterium massiliense TaxID=1658111 RepID=UPI0006B68C23|nr:peptidoglycan DD-metalloendopeptidase family protein [Inediibacterium massiliense]